MWLRFLPVIVVTVLLAAIGLASLGSAPEKQDPFASKFIGKAFPENPDKQMTAKIFDKNKPTIVNFFASWCPPCRVEHPQIIHLKKQHDLQVIGIAFKDTNDSVDTYLEELGDPYDVVIVDDNGDLGYQWLIHGAPETFFINNDNVIVHNHAGPIRAADLIRLGPVLEKIK